MNPYQIFFDFFKNIFFPRIRRQLFYAETEAKFAEARAQIEKYKKDTPSAGRDDLKFTALVFKGKGDVSVCLQ
jgi:hypothetical protein